LSAVIWRMSWVASGSTDRATLPAQPPAQPGGAAKRYTGPDSDIT
jgi:hypothetical protein